jgi:hypothetical protein
MVSRWAFAAVAGATVYGAGIYGTLLYLKGVKGAQVVPFLPWPCYSSASWGASLRCLERHSFSTADLSGGPHMAGLPGSV